MSGIAINVFAHRERLLHALRTGEELPLLIRRMALGSLLWALLYGLVLGAQVGGWQVVSSPIKLPLILMGTGVICGAALYVMLALAGAGLQWRQVLGLVLCYMAASGVTMVCVLPVAAFWTLAFHGQRDPITLVHTGAFTVCGVVGARFGLEMANGLFGERRLVRLTMGWMAVYALVAQQMAYLFRPHFNPTNVFMRPLNSGGSSLQAIWEILTQFFR
jgi:hypothetical protein